MKMSGMKLPFHDEAEVPEAKLVAYLFDLNHRAGKSKARFFLGHGYSAEQWPDFAKAMRRHAGEHEVAREETTPLGLRFVVEGDMAMPDGVIARIRSVWFIERGERLPRFITAYPLRRRRQI